MDEQALYDHAVSLLAKRDYACGEMRHLLSRDAKSPGLADNVIDRLCDHHYLDDRKMIAREIDRQVGKGHGPARIRQALGQKRLDADLAGDMLDALEVDWYEMATALREKKFGSEIPSEQKDKAKQIRYLQYRGHAMPVIMDILS